jgi:hypothetical protein
MSEVCDTCTRPIMCPQVLMDGWPDWKLSWPPVPFLALLTRDLSILRINHGDSVLLLLQHPLLLTNTKTNHTSIPCPFVVPSEARSIGRWIRLCGRHTQGVYIVVVSPVSSQTPPKVDISIDSVALSPKKLRGNIIEDCRSWCENRERQSRRQIYCEAKLFLEKLTCIK